MKIKPTVPLVIGLWVGYLVAWIGTAVALQPDGADFVDAFSDLSNSRYLVYGLAVATVYGAVVATAFGWWRDIVSDDRRTVASLTGWHRHVPLIALVLILLTTDYPGLAKIDTELLAWIIAASVLVGIAEELMFRGNSVVAARRVPLPEASVWLLSSTLFALIHVPNVMLGASLLGAILNTALSFLGGTIFYAVRRASGSNLVAMLIHGLWDFTLFSAEEEVYGAIRTPLYIIFGLALIATRQRMFSASDEQSIGSQRQLDGST